MRFAPSHSLSGVLLALASAGAWAAEATAKPAARIDSGDTGWMLVSAALVLLMTVPGVALFYAGLVRRKNALATTAMVLGSTAFVTLAWMVIGYSLAFSSGTSWIGGASRMLLEHLTAGASAGHVLAPSVPESVFVLFQLGFAVVTVALIFGAVVERLTFAAAMLFSVLWVLLVYAPVAHWIWHPEGWLHQTGHLDFAGGTVVHLASGVAGLVLAGMTGARRGYGREPMTPHNLMLSMTGACLLWIGWFGFNGGSAMQASAGAGMASMVTQIAAAAGIVAWVLCEAVVRGQVSLLGMASGLMAGLIAITPASGYVGTVAALQIGLIGSVLCFFTVTALKSRLGYDDSLDVFGLHGVAGFTGTVLTGAYQTAQGDIWRQVGVQAAGALAVALYVAAATALIAWLLRFTIGLRVEAATEAKGLDLQQHGESLAA